MRGTHPANFVLMRRLPRWGRKRPQTPASYGGLAGLLFGAALGVFAPAAAAQQAPRPPPSAVAGDGKPAVPSPLVEPPYDPAKHAGLAEAAWLRATRGTGRRSTGMMVTGIILDVVGASLMAAGTVDYVNGNNQPCVAAGQSALALPCSSTTAHVTGMALLASGVIGLGLGLPLTIHGAADVPRAEAGAVTGPRFPRATVALGLRGATFALHF